MSKAAVAFAVPEEADSLPSPTSIPKVGDIVMATPYEVNRDSVSCRIDTYLNVYGIYAKDRSAHYHKIGVKQKFKVVDTSQRVGSSVVVVLANEQFDIKYGSGGLSATRDRLREKLEKRKAAKGE